MKEKTGLTMIRITGVISSLGLLIAMFLSISYWSNDILTPLSKEGNVEGILFWSFIMILLTLKIISFLQNTTMMIFTPKRCLKK